MYVPSYGDLAHGQWQVEVQAHGQIIVAVVAWLVWRERAARVGAPTRSATLAGSAALALGLALYIIGRSQRVALFEVGSHIPVFAGTVLLLLGWRALARLWFPLVFLSFLVPLPGFVVESITGPLKNIVSQVVELVLYGLDYPIARTGVILSIGQYQLLVADACSGLNSIYSLAALRLLYLLLAASPNLSPSSLLPATTTPI